MSKYCYNCGTQLSGEEKICANCGAVLVNEEEAVAENAVQEDLTSLESETVSEIIAEESDSEELTGGIIPEVTVAEIFPTAQNESIEPTADKQPEFAQNNSEPFEAPVTEGAEVIVKNKLGAGGVFKTFLLLFLTVILSLALIAVLSARMTTKEQVLNNAVDKLDFSNIQIGNVIENADYDNEATLADVVYSYVNNDNVSKKQIENIVSKADYSAILSDYTSQIAKYIVSGEKYDELTEDDIVKLVEDNAELIEEETGIDVEQDRNFENNVKNASTGYVRDLNKQVDNSLGSDSKIDSVIPLINFFLSPIFLVLVIVLLIAVLALMIRVYYKKNVSFWRATKAFGITLFTVGAIIVISSFMSNIIMSISLFKSKDLVPQLIAAVKYIIIANGMIVLSIGAFFAALSIIVIKLRKKSISENA